MQFIRRKRTISEHNFSKFRQFFLLLPKFCVSVQNKDKIIRTIHRCTAYQRFVDKTKPLHASQRQDPSDPTLFTLRCYPTDDLGTLDLTGIHWVIVGSESGPHARPMKEEWALSLLAQTHAAHASFFFKQWGTWGQDGIKRNKHANGKLLRGRVVQEMPG